MQVHELKRSTPNKSKRRVGRGGKRGKTSGKGTKGQKARTGNSKRPNIRDTIKKIPKLRGHGKNRSRTVNTSSAKPFGVNLSTLSVFANGDTVSPMTLREKKLVPASAAKPGCVKILGTGDLSTKLTFENCLVSGAAQEKIEKAGGTIAK